MKYLALLRGINVGGNKKVPMAELKKMFENLKFKNVKTLLNTGNVVFESDSEASLAEEKSEKILAKNIEEKFSKTFGFDSKIILRNMDEITKLIKSDPFKKIEIDENTRLYISFLGDKHNSKLKIPYTSENKDFQILKATDDTVISFLQLSPTMKTIKSMDIIEKEFGKFTTTRNWNTVLKIAKL
ncbi:MAG: DUF1697 domain-containing protein [Patescibacteria group bacterium]